jgi:hypothetical protein
MSAQFFWCFEIDMATVRTLFRNCLCVAWKCVKCSRSKIIVVKCERKVYVHISMLIGNMFTVLYLQLRN